MSERIEVSEFLGAFVVEADEIVATANASLLEIEVAADQGMPCPRGIRELFRSLHTIKGLAGMMGVEPIVEVAHALETLVRAGDRAGGTLARGAIEVALQGVAEISERVRAVAEHRAVAEPPERLLDAIAQSDTGTSVPVAVTAIPREWEARLSPSERRQLELGLRRAPAWCLSFTPSALNAARGITIASVRAALGAVAEIIKVVPRAITATAGMRAGVTFEILVSSNATPEALAEIASVAPESVVALVTSEIESLESIDRAAAPGRAVVRVELSRLDELQDQLSLLIVSRFRLEREIAALAELGHDVRRVREVAQLQGNQLRDLRRAILRARTVRVAEMLEPLKLLVRSLARSSQREVRLELDTHDAELDKAVADRLLPALVHLVRNAVDHAIEAPELRVAGGKPRAGSIRVSCREVAGNFVEVVVCDDGRGIDRAAISARASRPIDSDAMLLEVLASPGFSTHEIATSTSGRGVGMDIVHRIAVDELGGELSMTTRPGIGTSFTLRIPVTIAVMDVFSFLCGSQSFVVPAVVVEEIFELRPEMLVVPPNAGTRLMLLERRGHAMPIISLGALLAIDGGTQAHKALVIRRSNELIAFTVDRMIGRQEVVVRAIVDPLVNMPGIAGTTDLGDGRPTLVLDLHELGMLATQRGTS